MAEQTRVPMWRCGVRIEGAYGYRAVCQESGYRGRQHIDYMAAVREADEHQRTHLSRVSPDRSDK